MTHRYLNSHSQLLLRIYPSISLLSTNNHLSNLLFYLSCDLAFYGVSGPVGAARLCGGARQGGGRGDQGGLCAAQEDRLQGPDRPRDRDRSLGRGHGRHRDPKKVSGTPVRRRGGPLYELL